MDPFLVSLLWISPFFRQFSKFHQGTRDPQRSGSRLPCQFISFPSTLALGPALWTPCLSLSAHFFPQIILPLPHFISYFLFVLQESVLTSTSLILPPSLGQVPLLRTHNHKHVSLLGKLSVSLVSPPDSKILEIMDYIFFRVSAPHIKHGS